MKTLGKNIGNNNSQALDKKQHKSMIPEEKGKKWGVP